MVNINSGDKDYIVEQLSSGSVCIRLSSDPQVFAIGQNETEAMELLTSKLLNGAATLVKMDTLIDNLEMRYEQAALLNKAEFAFNAYKEGYLTVELPFSKHKDFVFFHALARLYFSNPSIFLFGILAILALVSGAFVELVNTISGLIASFM